MKTRYIKTRYLKSGYLTVAIVVAGMLMLGSCGKSSRSEEAAAVTEEALEHATLLRFENGDGYIKVDIKDPWHQGKLLHSYVLVDSGQPVPEKLPEGTLVRTPLKKALVGSAIHASLLGDLNASEAIAGLFDTEYINIPALREGLKEGRIKDCGSSMTPDIEKIADLSPDALMLSPFDGSRDYTKLESLGIPVIYMADYMESGPLARTEWAKFYGLLFGRSGEGEALYSETAKKYEELKKKASAAASKPQILFNKALGTTWYVPGGKSSTGQLLTDAGTTYAWSDDESTGSIPLGMETVIDKCSESDLWILTDTKELTYPMLEAENHSYAQFRPFKEKNVWFCNTAEVPYFEESPFHPDRQLHDIIIIAHPGLINEPLYYFKKLK